MSTGLSHTSAGHLSGDLEDRDGDREANHPAMHFVSPGAISIDSLSVFDEYAANPRFQELQTELRSFLLTEARSSGNSREHSPEAQDSGAESRQGHRTLCDHLSRLTPHIPLMKQVAYLKIWTTECAPWLDMFDQERHFGLQVPLLAQTSPAVFYALLALSARQAERHGAMKGSSQDSLGLYSEAISSLSTSLNSRQPDVVVTACILCVLEMMSVSPRDWRRHTQGCAALFEAAQVNGFSGGLLQAVFWCYARMDLCAAIIAEGAEGTVLSIEKWALLDPANSATLTQQSYDGRKSSDVDNSFLERGRQVPDMHANYAVYLCARVCDLLAQRTRYVELGDESGCGDEQYAQLRTQLWDDLQRWLDLRPPQLLPVKTTTATATHEGSTGKCQFPSILFAHWAAISSNQLYHTACILMLEMEPGQVDYSRTATINSPLWHARRVVGISLANEHRGCLNNAIQPLYVAGKLFTHREEHLVICHLLNHIEASSGWGSRWRIKDLEAAWGYSRGGLN